MVRGVQKSVLVIPSRSNTKVWKTGMSIGVASRALLCDNPCVSLNGSLIGMGEPHAYMTESTGSLSASSFSLLLQSFASVSSSNDRFSPSFRIYIVVIAINLLD